MSGAALDDAFALTVHGPVGVVDLLVPAGACAADVLSEYAAHSGSQVRLQVFTTTGRELRPETPLSASGVRSGALLVALPVGGAVGEPVGEHGPVAEGGPGAGTETDKSDADPTSGGWAVAAALGAAVVAVVAALVGAPAAGHLSRDLVLALLALGAAVGVLPFGRGVLQRGTAAPAFGAAVGLALTWQPEQVASSGSWAEPITIGAAGLGAAVVAALGRASGAGRPEVHTVWMVAGSGVFLVTGLDVLVGWPPQVAWATLLLAAMLSARWVTSLAVDVPDRLLVDLDRLAVTAWTAREERGAADSGPVPVAGVAEVLARGGRVVDASALAAFVVAVVSAPLLLGTATYDVDRTGAACLVLLAGAGLLLAARSFRHRRARSLLRWAGVWCEVMLLAHLLPDWSGDHLLWLTAASLALAGAVLGAAVATGRGWRSALWAARSDLAETVVCAGAIGAMVVATGLVRLVWEIPFVG